MDDRDYLLKVINAGKAMRDAQKKYFGNRTQDNLVVAKEAERINDKTLIEAEAFVVAEQKKGHTNIEDPLILFAGEE